MVRDGAGGISFLEAQLRFRAPGVTLRLVEVVVTLVVTGGTLLAA